MEAIEKTKEVILGNYLPDYDRIFYNSNEDLFSLFQAIQVKDKSVFTVLSSSDQLFHLYGMNPASVDTFDKNGLTKYYYYLRKWSILFCNNYYPDVFSNQAIYDIIKNVSPKNEEESDALQYWMNYIYTFYTFMSHDLFYINSRENKNKIYALKGLKEELLHREFSFEHMDISKKKLKKKYDRIIGSNILENYYFKGADMRELRNHIYDMLEDDGEFLTSYYMSSNASLYEKMYFDERFDSRKVFDENHYLIGCVYKKNVNKK